MVTLIRHLPTLGNQKRQYIGWTDEGILPVDPSQHCLPWHPAVVYGSDLQRCRESASLYFPKATYVPDKRLRESNFGDWEGKTYDILKENKKYRRWISDQTKEQPPNGESLEEVRERLQDFLKTLPLEEKTHTLVTHGGPIRLLLTQFSPEKKDFWSWRIPHRSIWQLVWENAQSFKEGKPCVSLSEVPITEKKPMCDNS